MIHALLAFLAPLASSPDTVAVRPGVEYRIEAVLDESTDVLRGRARLRYTNRAPQALDTLWFHQHLNAFRPNSAWAQRELRFGNRRFQTLGPAEHAYERLREVRVDGAAVRPVYPGAPDSTVVAVPLPRPLAPGATAEVLLDWDARLATVPRRQGRAGRHYDWAHWYPRIAVRDDERWHARPLLPQGEFFGEFARYDVTLDLAADQVVGSTGAVVEGTPGYTVTEFERTFYPARPAEPLGLLRAPAAGRRQVRWRAEDVIHFAWSANPRFVHEGVERFLLDDSGERTDLPPIHVLYVQGDREWPGHAARHTFEALRYVQRMFGPYPWPQLTNVQRLDRGGTEFPMLMMNRTASEGLIVHETVHQVLHGILANDEWAEGWLDEGFTSFMGHWYREQKGERVDWGREMDQLAEFERTSPTQPVATPGPEFRDFRTYQMLTYTKPSIVFYMLRELVGGDVMHGILREYYRRHRLRHVGETDFRRVVNEVSGQDLDWFFEQWLHTTATLSYGITDARARRLRDGRWSTTVEVARRGEAWMPVELRVGEEEVRLTSREPVQRVEIVTRERPARAELDPRRRIYEADRSRNVAVVR
jgi:hypothetical protein